MYSYFSEMREFYSDSGYEYAQKILDQYATGFLVTGCGFQRFMTKDFSISRPQGRKDYQILYMSQGKAHFLINGEMQVVEAGQFMVYHPGEPQFYEYFFSEKPEVYWVHFVSKTGLCPIQILNTSERIFEIGFDSAYADLFMKMIGELSYKKSEFFVLNSAYLVTLIAMFTRRLHNDRYTQNEHMDTCIVDTIHFIGHHYRENNTVSQLAMKSGLSLSRFTQKFKLATGMTPIEYVTQLRIKEAMTLMEVEDMSIKDISNIVGYSNPFYFSRIFKNVVGMPPSKYRFAE